MRVDQLVRGFRDIRNKLPRVIGAKSVTFFKENFRRRGFPMNGRLERWEQRKQPDYRKGGALLIKTGKLRRSIRVMRADMGAVIVGSDDPKAAGHNNGVDIEKQVTVPAHTRRSHKRKGYSRTIGGRRQRVRAHAVAAGKVGAHSRKMKLKLPRRQFIGHSPDLMKSIEREYSHLITEQFNKL